MVNGLLYIGPELPKDMPSITCGQSGTSPHQCMPGVRATFWIPSVGDEGGPVDACKPRVRRNARAAVGWNKNVADGSGTKATPEARLMGWNKARVFVVESGYAEAERAVDNQPTVTGPQARAEPRGALTPLGRFIVSLSECGAKRGVHQGLDSQDGAAVDLQPFLKAQAPSLQGGPAGSVREVLAWPGSGRI